MSWFGRLFGGSPQPNAVVIADDLVGRLGAPDPSGGSSSAATPSATNLTDAVNASLHEYFAMKERAREASARGEEIPFWLQRDASTAGEMEDALRDRVVQRRAAEDDQKALPLG